MARLIVEAVSVSRADDGSSVTGLDQGNFRVAAPGGLLLRLRVTRAHEHKSEPGDAQLSGGYVLSIDRYAENDLSQALPIIRGE